MGWTDERVVLLKRLWVEGKTAAEIAKTFGVRVYCIGVGSKGKALQPVALYPNGEMEYDYVDVDIDDATMTEITKMTGGKYFRATDRESLEKTYKEIEERMRKFKQKIKNDS